MSRFLTKLIITIAALCAAVFTAIATVAGVVDAVEWARTTMGDVLLMLFVGVAAGCIITHRALADRERGVAPRLRGPGP